VLQPRARSQWDYAAPPKDDFFGPGTRVPAIIASPFAKKRKIDHTQYDTTSILKLITERYQLPVLSGLTKRDAGLIANGGVADFVFGDLVFYEGERPIFHYAGDPYYAGSIHRRCPCVGHPTALARRTASERIGLFEVRYRDAMDYDYCFSCTGPAAWESIVPRSLGT